MIPKAENGSKRFYSVPEAAELLGVSGATLYREIAGGQFPAIKIRGRYVVPAKAIDQLEEAALSSVDLTDFPSQGWRT